MADIVTFEIPATRDAVEIELEGGVSYYSRDELRGDAATIAIGTVTTGAAGSNASVTNTGDEHDAVFNFTIPKGDKGDEGISPTLTASKSDSTTTIYYTDKTHTSGTDVLATIYDGQDGTNGTDGADGADGVSPTLSSSKTGKVTTIYYTDKTHTSGTDVLATINDGTDVALPTQTGNSGKFLTTNGSTASWANTPTEIPSQTGNSGKYLTTNGSAVSWASVVTSETDPVFTAALVTSVSSSSTDSQVPSAKLFYDTLGDVESVLTTLLEGTT